MGMIQPRKKGFRSPADFVNAANDLPPEHHAIDPAGKAAEIPVEETKPAPVLAPEVTGVASIAEKTTQTDKTSVPKNAQKRAAEVKKPAPQLAPWDEPGLKDGGYNFRMSGTLHAKLKWIAENVPKHKSIQIVLEKAVTAYADSLIEKHYQPDADE
jgi:hypothetical protein